jgi:hypothetical protein
MNGEYSMMYGSQCLVHRSGLSVQYATVLRFKVLLFDVNI